MSDIVKQIREIFEQAALSPKEQKQVLRDVVKENWPDLPVWTTLDGAVVEEVQKATAGSGVVLTFEEAGVRKVVLAQTGDHYAKPGEAAVPAFMIPGGFINLSETPGSSLVAASSAPEDGRTGAAREVEEELKNPDGSALLKVDPSRLKPMDTLTLAFRGEKRIVIGMMLELNAAEVKTVKEHIANIAASPAYAAATAAQSINHDSGKPEVSNVAIFTLEDVAAGKVNLLHKDQQSLFKVVEQHYKDVEAQVRRAIVQNNQPRH
ncbi:MAG: hypothetical protein PW788_00365 [Micavibrio sp.]|nr:hypothetical protein [Micavibrio sp.]